MLLMRIILGEFAFGKPVVNWWKNPRGESGEGYMEKEEEEGKLLYW